MSANDWKLDDGRTIKLLTPEQLTRCTQGTRLICIDGKEYVVGRDHIDDDTRGSYLAYGVLPSDPNPIDYTPRAPTVIEEVLARCSQVQNPEIGEGEEI